MAISEDQTCTKQPPATTRQKETKPITPESDPSSSINTVEIVSSNDTALRPSIILKYQTYQINWNNYCMQNNISYIQPKISELLDYFTNLYNSRASYSVLNSSKSALSHIVPSLSPSLSYLSPYSSI